MDLFGSIPWMIVTLMQLRHPEIVLTEFLNCFYSLLFVAEYVLCVTTQLSSLQL